MRQFGSIASLVLSLFGTAGCANPAADPPAHVVDDTTIASGVKAALAVDPVLKGAEIDVAASRGEVRLSGFVSSADDVAAAASAARSVKGVTSVRNDLRLK